MVSRIRIKKQISNRTVSYLTPDKGKAGRTPESERWYRHNIDTGWQKDMPADTRRALMLKAHGGDNLAAARAMLALHNVTTDKGTKRSAQDDADYFFRAHRLNKQIGFNETPRNIMPMGKPISPKYRPMA